MAEIIPFKGLLYNPEKVDATSVVAPPYDIVTLELKEELYRRSPYNIIRVDYGKDEEGDDAENNRYTRASGFLDEWMKKGILRQDERPSFYCYQINYMAGGREKVLRGLLAAVRIEELGSGCIRPHEVTYSKPKSDRLNIIRFCRANISPIFSLYSSRERLTSSILRKVSMDKPFLEARNGDGFVHSIWRIEDEDDIEVIKKEFHDKDIFIADGHHRYETALEFRNEMKAGFRSQSTEDVTPHTKGQCPWDYVLMFLANMEDDGLTLLPTHRLVRIGDVVMFREKLTEYFVIRPFDISVDGPGKGIVEAIQSEDYLLGVLIKGDDRVYGLKPKDGFNTLENYSALKGLGVTVLHDFILKKIVRNETFVYEMDISRVIREVRDGSYNVAFFLAPTRVEDVRRAAIAGQRMPPKSTYFYPKLLTGMVIYKF
jgi:uncharacterized protein (DUF1015 family)